MDVSLALVCLGGLVSGLVGSLMGLGGGIVAVPYLTLVMGVPMHAAACAGLVSTLSVACSAAGSYLRQGGLIDIHMALKLELYAALGGLCGGIAAGWIEDFWLKILFSGLMMSVAGYITWFNRGGQLSMRRRAKPGSIGIWLGFGACFVAGLTSGLLGIGGGVVVVPVLLLIFGLPFKAATATSNFMMGFTAIPALLGYIARNQLVVEVAIPLAAGVLVGAYLGAKLLPRLRVEPLKAAFAVILALTAVKMAYEGWAAW